MQISLSFLDGERLLVEFQCRGCWPCFAAIHRVVSWSFGDLAIVYVLLLSETGRSYPSPIKFLCKCRANGGIAMFKRVPNKISRFFDRIILFLNSTCSVSQAFSLINHNLASLFVTKPRMEKSPLHVCMFSTFILLVMFYLQRCLLLQLFWFCLAQRDLAKSVNY